jgi:polysaccharide biosynthesis transport protein
VIGSIPFVSSGALRLLDPEDRTVPDYLVRRPMTRFAESYRMLRAGLIVSTPDARLGSIAVTSAVAEEGKSTAALCLARLSALAGQRALLIDCDLRNPSLSQYFGIAPTIGLREVLAGSVGWRQVIGTDSRTRAHVLPATASDPDSADLFNGEAFRSLLDELRGEYDVIVLNCAPVHLVADSVLVAAQADRVILTTNWKRTSQSALKSAIDNLLAAKANVVGIVLNQVDFRDWHGQLRTSSYYTREHYTGPNWFENMAKGASRVAPAS